jgi:hypothetical protein
MVFGKPTQYPGHGGPTVVSQYYKIKFDETDFLCPII